MLCRLCQEDLQGGRDVCSVQGQFCNHDQSGASNCNSIRCTHSHPSDNAKTIYSVNPASQDMLAELFTLPTLLDCCYTRESSYFQQSWFTFAEQSSHLTASGRMQVYDTITDAMYTSLARFEQASGIPQTRQLSKWQHLLAGD